MENLINVPYELRTPQYDAVIFSSDDDGDIHLARKLEEFIKKEIILTFNGNDCEVSICTFHDSFPEVSSAVDRVEIALENSSLYFIILTKNFLENKFNIKYKCHRSIWESINNKKRTNCVFPIYSKMAKNDPSFLEDIKYFKMITPIYFEDLLVKNTNFMDIGLEDLNKFIMESKTKIKLTKIFNNKLVHRFEREDKLAKKVNLFFQNAINIQNDDEGNDVENDESIYTIVENDSLDERKTSINLSLEEDSISNEIIEYSSTSLPQSNDHGTRTSVTDEGEHLIDTLTSITFQDTQSEKNIEERYINNYNNYSGGNYVNSGINTIAAVGTAINSKQLYSDTTIIATNNNNYYKSNIYNNNNNIDNNNIITNNNLNDGTINDYHKNDERIKLRVTDCSSTANDDVEQTFVKEFVNKNSISP